MLLPLTMFSLIGAAAYRQMKRLKPLSPEIKAQRKIVYDAALNSKQTPENLRTLAEAFRNEGMMAEAKMLDKRAALREAPKELTQARREAFKRAMASKDVAGIKELSAAFDDIGATGAAKKLSDYAKALETAAKEPTP